jgi:small subunit ribosomal protein S15
MALSVAEKATIVNQHQQSANDVGSTPVQIALLTENIKKLTLHLRVHKKDVHSQRGLLAMVNKRRKLLTYLKHESFQDYRDLIAKLNLRH